MITRQQDKYVIVELEEDDFKYRDWRGFLAELKHRIPWAHREYKVETKAWYIIDTPHNLEVLAEMREKYFEDKEQQRLF